MASPVDSARVATNISTAATSAAINVGSPVAGTLLIVLLRWTENVSGVSFPGYTEINLNTDDAANDWTGIYYRFADGSEGATDTISWTTSSKLAAICWEITGAHPTLAPGASGPTTYTTAANAGNPPSMSNSGLDYLFLALIANDGESAASAAPTNYSNLITANTGTTGTADLNAVIAGASRQLTTSSPEDPAAFTHAAANAGGQAWTLRVRPPASVAHTFDGTDTVALVDSPTLEMGFDLQLPDTVALADSLTLAIGIDLQATDTVALADSLTADLSLLLDLADPLALADLFDSQLDQLLDLVDTVALVDLFDAPLVLVSDLVDTVLLDDLFDAPLSTGLDLSDTVGLIDSFSSVVGENEISFTDVATLTDDLTWTATYDETFVDTVGLADSLALAAEIGLVPTDTVALADLFDSTFGRNVDFVDVMGLVDDPTLALDSALALADTLPLADSLTVEQSSTAVTGESVLTLKGKAFTLPEPVYAHFLGDAALILKGKAFTLVLSDIAVTGKAKLILRGKTVVGTQPGLTITVPLNVNLVPTTASNVTLNGATCADVNLVPTVEEFR